MKNFLKYTSLSYDEILRQVDDKLNSDERFANFRESAIARTLVEIFAGAVDIVNYYLERRAEECFFDTARLRSSVILLARQLGYVVTRPIPAEARLKIKLKGNWTELIGLNQTSTIQVPVQSVFSYGGLKFILKKKITLNYSDYSNILISQNAETSFINTDVDGDYIEVVQGEIKEKVFEGNTNTQVGSTFQIYRIDDTEFSNKYAEDDYDFPMTKVWVGNTKSDATEFSINRRSLLDWEVINEQQTGVVSKVCVIRTSVTEGVELQFGDGRSTELGAKTSNDNIYVQYLATKGSEANQVGAKDKKIQFSGKVYDSQGNDVTDKIEFYFSTNITNGADMEDIESIRVNAPNIYYSLDRLVTKTDYISYLKSLTSPIVIKNAIAWGEQEELKERGFDALLRLFNIVFFSVVGHLYQTDTSPYYVKTKANGLDSAVLDFKFDDDELNQRNYFNVFTKGFDISSSNLIEQLNDYQTSAYIWKIEGDDLDQTKDGQYYSVTYLNNMQLKINYTSDIIANNIYLSGSKTITLDVAGLSAETNFDNAMNNIAIYMQTALRDIDDERGNNNFQNANFTKKAFPNIIVSYNSLEKEITITHESESPTYISLIENVGPIGESSAASDLGLSTAQSFLTTIDRELSSKIITVVNDLDSRSQVTIRNIYISPVIQTIKLEGSIYIKDLYDRQTEKVNIEDAIYAWLDDNADFNKEIYISNIVELIQQFPSVLYADVKFVPDYPIEPNGGNFYNFSAHNAIENTGLTIAQKESLYTIINTNLNNYLTSSNISDISGSTEKNLVYTINSSSKEIQSYSFSWNPNITERTFLEIFAKTLYLQLKSNSDSNIVVWADSDNFIKLISDIRKDYLKIIRFNMIDTVGNIAKDNQLDLNGKSIKGGYSLGNEIVKISANLSYRYKR